MEENSTNPKEERIRKITSLYYSRPEIQNAIFEFCKNREVVPRYFEGFGKRPDTFQYPNDLFELVKRGATSFHCSEEIWTDPLELSLEQKKEDLKKLRTNWDLLIDIDCKWFDYSKKAAQAIISVLQKFNIKNIGLKFSGNKGFHILVPSQAFPKEIAGQKTSELFPELPRKIVSFLRIQAEKELKQNLPEDFYSQFKDVKIRKGIKCNNCGEIAEETYLQALVCPRCRREELKKMKLEEFNSGKVYKCSDCGKILELNESKSKKIYECKKCKISSKENPNNFSRTVEIDLFELMGLDLVLVSPRHLFRTPYSLHEKTSLASVVLKLNELEKFEPPDANALKIKEVRNFMPDSIEGEASKLLMESLDWAKKNEPKKEIEKKAFSSTSSGSFNTSGSSQPVIKIEKISDNNFPPSLQKILQGLEDGKKRALFILINFLHSIGSEKPATQQRLFEWNQKNNPKLDEGYINTQIEWSYRKAPVLPPNFDKDYYRGIGIIPNQEELNYKNPVNYFIKKSLSEMKKPKSAPKKRVSKKPEIKKQETK
ncbi:MAG TPA: hypothetical protein PLK34_02885 [Candidatus Pacearchaeota archaeon]|nr:hypothetical protein [Candidatus Pacearchaeota archaeon]